MGGRAGNRLIRVKGDYGGREGEGEDEPTNHVADRLQGDLTSELLFLLSKFPA